MVLRSTFERSAGLFGIEVCAAGALASCYGVNLAKCSALGAGLSGDVGWGDLVWWGAPGRGLALGGGRVVWCGVNLRGGSAGGVVAGVMLGSGARAGWALPGLGGSRARGVGRAEVNLGWARWVVVAG